MAQVAAAPERGAHQAEAKRRLGDQSPGSGCLFWVRLGPPSASCQWEVCARLECARVRVCVQVCMSPSP